MIVAETAIDMLSYAALRGIDGKRFFSTAGQISSTQAECLRRAIGNMPTGSTVVLAVDHDEGGQKLARQIREALAPTGCRIVEDIPPQSGADWNDVLRQTVVSEVRIPGLP